MAGEELGCRRLGLAREAPTGLKQGNPDQHQAGKTFLPLHLRLEGIHYSVHMLAFFFNKRQITREKITLMKKEKLLLGCGWGNTQLLPTEWIF